MDRHPLPSSRNTLPRIWFFEGWTTLLLLGGVVMFLILIKFLAILSPDSTVLNVVLSAIPLAVFALFSATLVKGKPPSYHTDFFLWKLFRLWTRLYLKGSVGTRPVLWHQPPATPHPSTFN
jgi:hypothetical protein